MRLKKAICGLLALVMMIGIVQVNSALAVTDPGALASWTDNLTAAPNGWQEEGDVITISSAKGLAWLAVQVNGMNGQTAQNFAGKTVKLSKDINLSGKMWTPIGNTYDTSFTGAFDGQNHTIKNMSIVSNSEYSGLFGSISSVIGTTDNPTTIKNIKLTDVTIVAGGQYVKYVGALAGRYNATYGEITGCTASGEIKCDEQSYASPYPYTGGFIGNISATISGDNITAKVTNCTADVDISGKTPFAGGFVGSVSGNSEVVGCGAYGDLDIDDPATTYWGVSVGGFAGDMANLNGPLIIKQCFSKGKVEVNATVADGDFQYVGGFIGGESGVKKSILITECMTSSDVTAELTEASQGSQFVGGFIGAPLGTQTEITDCYSLGDVTLKNGTMALGGGFTGYCAGTIENCYSVGDVTASGDGLNRAFGFCANVANGTIRKCFALSESVKADNVSYFLSTGASGTLTDNAYYSGMNTNGGTPLSNGITPTAMTEEQITYDFYSVLSSTPENTRTNSWIMQASNKLPILYAIDDDVQKTNKPGYLKEKVTLSIKLPTEIVYDGKSKSDLFVAGNITAMKDDSTVKPGGYEIVFYDKDNSEVDGDKLVNAGDYSAVIKVVDDNYCGNLTVDFTIKKATVTITVKNISVKVGAAEPVLGDDSYTVSGLAEGDTLKVKPTLSYVGDTEMSKKGTVVIHAESAELQSYDNYESEIVYKDGKLTKKKSGGGGSSNSTNNNGNTNSGNSGKGDNSKDDNSKPQMNAWSNPFNDVKSNDWYFNSVKYVNENGLMSGVTAKQFAPNEPITRGMLVTILYRAENEPNVSGKTVFADVADSMYYAKAVLWAEKNDIVKGLSATEFAPNDSVTRQELATMLYRYAKYAQIDTTQGGMAVREFVDWEQTADWAIAAMQWAVNTKIIGGSDGNMLLPNGNATRAEVATMIMRLQEI